MRGTPRQAIRIDPEVWADFGDAAQRADPPADRSELVRQFIDWYRRERGVVLPKRPDRSAGGHDPVS